MSDVYIAGIGMTPAGEHWEKSLRELAFGALEAAAQDTERVLGGRAPAEALFAANALAGQLSGQAHLGVLIADFAGLRGIEAATIEAAGASGGAALRQAYIAVASGQIETALVVGVEKITDTIGARVNGAAATAGDSDFESAQGVTPAALAGLVMQRYLHTYGVSHDVFANFAVNAHANARANANAMFRNAVTREAYVRAGAVADPISMLDVSPECDGAAAVVLTSRPTSVRVAASAQATDTLALHDRPDLLGFDAAQLASGRAYKMAGIGPNDIDVFELFDAYSIFAALSLEAAGFAERGKGWQLAVDEQIGLDRRIPIQTFGGLKARGNPIGATGLYQIAELTLQLRGEAGANQVPGARVGMAQCIGGIGSNAVSHILVAA